MRCARLLPCLLILFLAVVLAACIVIVRPVEIRNYASENLKIVGYRADDTLAVSLECPAGKAIRFNRTAAGKAGLTLPYLRSNSGNYIVVFAADGKELFRKEIKELLPEKVDGQLYSGTIVLAVTKRDMIWLYKPETVKPKTTGS